MEKELQQKLEEIAFRLQRLADDYHDLLKELSQMDVVKKAGKIIYEQYVTVINDEKCYTFKNSGEDYLEIINLVKNPIVQKYSYYNYHKNMIIANTTKKIIETYIPSQNIVLVVEL
jgi:hypothetical protein